MLRPRRDRAASRHVLINCLALLATSNLAAQPPVTPAEMDLEQLMEVRVEVATGIPQPLSRAPAVASVITAEDIRAMGATELDEVLETIPGLHVVPSKGRGLDSIYSIRGIHSSQNAQVLVLLDGIPLTQLLTGGPALGFRMPVAAIARVEVIRGPGSAVYGADAFAGVINIITKSKDDIDESTVTLRGGSFGTAGGSLVHGTEWAGFDVALTLDYRMSEGDEDRLVESDLQTLFDGFFGTDASLAPGSLDSAYDLFDVHLDLDRGPWDLHFWAFGNERGLGPGGAGALDPPGSQKTRQFLVDAIYERDDWAEDWVFTQRLSYLFIDQAADFRAFPPGTRLPIGADGNINPANPVNLVLFPDGAISRPGDEEESIFLDSVAVFTGLAKHRLRFNAGFSSQDVDTKETKNFGPGAIPEEVLRGESDVVDGTLTVTTGTPDVFLPSRERDHGYLSFQDEWSITERVELTAGLRFDEYSDFGGTLNPRLALVWTARHDLSAKLLFGSAFRAPSFGQLFNSNNPAGLGNPDLDPEEIDTFELALDYHPRPGLRAVANLFRYRIDGLIEIVPDDNGLTSTAQNANNQDGYGFELELAWEPCESLSFETNFAWQHAEEEPFDDSAVLAIADAPERQFYAALRWEFAEDFSFFAQVDWIGPRQRGRRDARRPLDDYTVTDLVLERRNLGGDTGQRWDLTLTARNLFDEEGLEPSNPDIPGDFPIPGRALFAEVRFHFP